MSGSAPRDAASRRLVWLIVGGLLMLGAVLAFLVIPLAQGRASGIDSFTAICRAFGILPGTPAQPSPRSTASAQPVSRVAWSVQTLHELEYADRQHGAKVAEERCVACHQPDGASAAPTIPRMAGQSTTAIYKQLHDFRSGARVNEIMSAQVQGLDDKSIADVAVYYGRLLRGASDLQSPPFVGEEVSNLVVSGDVGRGLPPCSACHGVGVGGPIETPTLTSQHLEYLEAQLQAFASSQRHNDIYHRMRSVASRLTPREMHLLAIYYAGAR